MNTDPQDKLTRIRASKRDSARRAREKAKQEGRRIDSDEKKERLRVIKQTIAGGDTRLTTLTSLKIDLSVLSDYCNQNNCNLNKIKQSIIEFLRENHHMDTHHAPQTSIYDHILSLESFLTSTKSIYTAKSYLSHLNTIKHILNTPDNQQFITALNSDPKSVCDMLHESFKENIMAYLSAIIFIIRKFDEIKTVIGDDVLQFYVDALSQYKQQYLYLRSSQTEGNVPWDQIIDLKTKIDSQYRYGMYHLLISLYTCIPPMRDDFGCIRIITNDTQLNQTDNFYVIATDTFHFNHYKTVSKYKPFHFKTPEILRDIILGSLQLNPRPYLITQNLNRSDQPYKDGKLTALIPKLFKIDQYTHLSINDFRHAFETYMGQYGIDFDLNEKLMINQIIGHDSDQRDFYIRDQIRSKPLFKKNYDKSADIVQRISDKIGGFYDIGDQIVPYQLPPPIKKIKICIKKQN
jgi:hypothetical protein|uniref:Uncharacterized protein n=1 Tax=viral metagenome TaxID=1070528 RepID=A0A6C0BLX4_9ZZZZ